MRSRGLFLLLGALALTLGGCATVAAPDAPAETVITLAEAGTAEPVGVAAEVSANTSEGLSENEWGGEVPQSLPSDGVDEGGLGDLE